MNVIIAKDYDELSEKAARIMIETVRQKPDAVLGLATGTCTCMYLLATP